MKRHEFIKKRAKELRENTPKSEVWFKNLYYDFKHEDDQFNCVLYGAYIPDIFNDKYKYIIEIDGSVHNKKSVKERDLYKDSMFKRNGWDVIRVKAYDLNSFKECIEKLRIIRQTKKWGKQLALNYKQKVKPKVILKKSTKS